MSDHERKLLEKRRQFGELLIAGKSFAEAARIVKLSPAYTSRLKRGFDELEHGGGNPKDEEDAMQAQKAVDEYFASCEPEYWKDADGKEMLDSKKHPIIKSWQRPTIAGLAMALGYVTREGFMQATIGDGEYARVLTCARFRIEREHEENLYNPGSRGSEFALKNIAGWTDKQEIRQEVNASVQTKLDKLEPVVEDRIKKIAKSVLRPADSESEGDDGQES